MPCIFCDSDFHLTQNCDVYVTDEDRKECAIFKKFCISCLSKSHYRKCKRLTLKMCYICLSKGTKCKHPMVLCPHRFNVPALIIPKLDANLLSRFMQMFNLNGYDRYSMAFSSQKAFNFLKLKKINMKKDDEFNGLLCDVKDKNDEINVVTDRLLIEYVTSQNRKQFFETTISNAERVIIDVCRFSAKDFFYLLSYRTSILDCFELTVTPSITFGKLLEQIPNIHKLRIRNSNIEFDNNSWPEELLNCKNNVLFSSLEMDIKNFDFDFEKLALFMKTKCTQEFIANLCIIIPPREAERAQKELRKNISKFFVPEKYMGVNQPRLSIYIVQDFNNQSLGEPFEYFMLKNYSKS